MASQADALAQAVAQPAPLTLAALPHALHLEVLSRLPVDCRLRCAEVYRSWRAAADDPTLWRHLDFSPATGGLARAASDALLRAAAARAAGQLETLDVSSCTALSHDALLAVVTANRASLRELHICHSPLAGKYCTSWPGAQEVEALLRAAPGLRAYDASAGTFELPVARAMLRSDPPFVALRLRRLYVGFEAGGEDAAAVLELAADLVHCVFLRELDVQDAALNVPGVLDELVNAALACRLHTLCLDTCVLSAASAPSLARLLGGGVLAELWIDGRGDPCLDALAAAVLAIALRTSSTLTALTLRRVDLWHEPAAATALLDALTGHVSLQTLDLSHNNVNLWGDGAVAAGAALGALVGANSPALTALDVRSSRLGNAGLRPLFNALQANTHLTELVCSANDLTDTFVRRELLPAMRANGSLQRLSCTPQMKYLSDLATHLLAEAETLVAQRAANR
jgi:hypothetical protein